MLVIESITADVHRHSAVQCRHRCITTLSPDVIRNELGALPSQTSHRLKLSSPVLVYLKCGGGTSAVGTTRERKEVKERIEIQSVNFILFTYRRCSIRPPSTSIQFVNWLIMSCRILGNIPDISRMTKAERYLWQQINWTWSSNGLASSLTRPHTIGFPFLGVHENPDVRDSCGDTTRSCGTNTSNSWSRS